MSSAGDNKGGSIEQAKQAARNKASRSGEGAAIDKKLNGPNRPSV